MLKLLHKDDTQTTPFAVTKNWGLSNVTNEDSILMEHSGSDGLPVALEYLVLLPNEAITASACNIALEQQTDDLARYRSGLKLSGIFYPNLEPTNLDGTYKRVVYSQVVNMFYNDYRDPTKIWGLEQIDFDKSQTKRFLSDKFKMFEIPQPVYGEKIIPNTVKMVDRTTDNDYTITDDGHCNLFAGKNIFAHQQELGNYSNQYLSGSSGYCDSYYDNTSPPDAPLMDVLYYGCLPSASISWNVNNWTVTSYVVEKSTDGINYSQSFNGLGYSFNDVNIDYSGSYWYRMYAVNNKGTSSYSSVAMIFAESVYWDTDADFWDIAGTYCGPASWSVSSSVSSCMVLDHYVDVASFNFQIGATGQETNGKTIITDGTTHGAIFNTVTETVDVDLFADKGLYCRAGIYVQAYDKFFISNLNSNVDVLDGNGNLLASDILTTSYELIYDEEICYNPNSNKVYAIIQDNPHGGNYQIVEIDPVTYATTFTPSPATGNSDVITGGNYIALFDVGNYVIDIVSTSNLSAIHSSVDVSMYPYGVGFGNCYATSNGKMYFPVYKNITDSNASAVIEVNPATGTIDYEYDFGSSNDGIYGLSYNSVTDRIVTVFNGSYNGGWAINPIARTTCSISIPLYSNSAYAGPIVSDVATGKTFVVLSNGTNGLGVLV